MRKPPENREIRPSENRATCSHPDTVEHGRRADRPILKCVRCGAIFPAPRPETKSDG